MIEFTREEEIPEIEGRFKPAEETLEIKAILESMEVGEILCFHISHNQPEKDYIRERNRMILRAKAAAKMANNGRFKALIRKGNIWVERLD